MKVYEASPPEVAEFAKKLPLGRLYANGRGFVPNIRQSLYSDLVVALGLEPQAALSKNGDKDGLPAARGLPSSWNEIAAGHLVIAQESLEYGWWEAIVLERKGETARLWRVRCGRPAGILQDRLSRQETERASSGAGHRVTLDVNCNF